MVAENKMNHPVEISG